MEKGTLAGLPERWQEGVLGKRLQPIIEASTERIRSAGSDCRERGVLITERDPLVFVGNFLGAVSLGVPVFLGNPGWKEFEWDQVSGHVTPALVFGEDRLEKTEDKSIKEFSRYIMIPTGGSSGGVRFAMHRWESLVDSAKETAAFLETDSIDACCVLPVYHISGLIQAIRALVTGGDVCFYNYKELERSNFPALEHKAWTLSLVPTQLQRLLRAPGGVNWLRTFKTIFLGGGAADETLLNYARMKRIRLSPTYGATESASMISALKVENFLSGKNGVGQVFPHFRIWIDGGSIRVAGKSLFYGYFPETPQQPDTWCTGDEGWLDGGGFLYIKGRTDRILITGGEKVDPREVEGAIAQIGWIESVMVCGVPDKEWGTRVVAFYLEQSEAIDQEGLQERLKGKLARYKIPKDWIMVDRLPVDNKGKADKRAVEEVYARHTESPAMAG